MAPKPYRHSYRNDARSSCGERCGGVRLFFVDPKVTIVDAGGKKQSQLRRRSFSVSRTYRLTGADSRPYIGATIRRVAVGTKHCRNGNSSFLR